MEPGIEGKKEAYEMRITRKWYCSVMGDYVQRGGHCSEYEVKKDVGGCFEGIWR